MNTINVENCKTLLIGRRGENEVTTVSFDFTEWASEFGSGVVDLYVKRFGDDSAYPVVLTIDGTVASWLVTETDTNVAGYGKAEYVYRVDGKIAKSAVFPFFVAEDIGQPASEPPDPYESWLEQLTALGAETEAHAQAAEQSAEDAAESAEDAAQSAASAEGYAGQAETAAGLAQAAQTASEAARDAAQTAQASAESSATAASGSAASAAGSATSAAGSASDASASATAAGASASAASASATTASTAATAAQTAQSAAEDAAEDAQQAAQQAHVEYEQLSGEVDDLSDEVSQQKSAISNVEDELFVREELTGNPIVVTDAVGGKTDLTTSASKVYVFAKNMVAVAGRTAITTGDQSNLTVRDLTGYKLYVGLGSSNYFNNGQVDSYSISGETVTVKNKGLLGYGLAFTIPHVVGGAKMVVTWKTGTNLAVKIGFYNNGTYISNFTANTANLGKFEVPATANQLIVCVEPNAANTTATLTGLQLEYANAATPYTAPIIPEEYAVSDGSATLNLNKDFTLSASDSMTISYLKNEWSFEDDYATPSDVAAAIADAQKSWFYGKKICTFGDSVTAMNKWQPFLAQYLGATYTVHGVGGCTVALTANEEHQTDCMYMNSRINELESDADVILVFGGHNDWSNRVPIGSFPTDNTLELNDSGAVGTFVYAYALMLKKLMATYPNAKIYTMSCLGGRWDDTGTLNYDGHYYINGVDMEDYADAVKMVSAYYAIPCIDISSLSGINTLNHAEYLADAIHPNVAGGKLIANTVARELLRFEPIDFTSDWDDIKDTYKVSS